MEEKAIIAVSFIEGLIITKCSLDDLCCFAAFMTASSEITKTFAMFRNDVQKQMSKRSDAKVMIMHYDGIKALQRFTQSLEYQFCAMR